MNIKHLGHRCLLLKEKHVCLFANDETSGPFRFYGRGMFQFQIVVKESDLYFGAVCFNPRCISFLVTLAAQREGTGDK